MPGNKNWESDTLYHVESWPLFKSCPQHQDTRIPEASQSHCYSQPQPESSVSVVPEPSLSQMPIQGIWEHNEGDTLPGSEQLSD